MKGLLLFGRHSVFAICCTLLLSIFSFSSCEKNGESAKRIFSESDLYGEWKMSMTSEDYQILTFSSGGLLKMSEWHNGRSYSEMNYTYSIVEGNRLVGTFFPDGDSAVRIKSISGNRMVWSYEVIGGGESYTLTLIKQ